MAKFGYHDTDIRKGVLGELSKIVEEYDELIDANTQGNQIMELCELSDMLGAIDAYVKKRYNLTIYDVLKMMHATQDAFTAGRRK